MAVENIVARLPRVAEARFSRPHVLLEDALEIFRLKRQFSIYKLKLLFSVDV